MEQYENTIKVLNDFAEALITEYKDELSTAGYSSGKLYNTINVNGVRVTAGNFLVQINLEEYWKYIEYGRKAGSKPPPITAIHDWIIKRNIIPRPIQLKSGETRIPSQLSLAFAISKSIGKNGIKARPFMKKAMNKVKQEFIEQIKEALVQDIEAAS